MEFKKSSMAVALWAFASVGVWAQTETQSPSYSFSEEDGVLTVTGNGKVTDVYTEDKNTMLFTAEGVSNVSNNQYYNSLKAGDTYNSNTTYYYKSEENSWTQIENNSTYFAEHSDYIAAKRTYTFIPALQAKLTEGNKTVIFKSSTGKAEDFKIDNTVTIALTAAKTIRILNLENCYLDDEFKGIYTDEQQSNKQVGTFSPDASNVWTQCSSTIETLYTPEVKKGTEIKYNFFGNLSKLRYLYLGEGIQTLGKDAITKQNQGLCLAKITLPNSLEKICSGAVSGHYIYNGKNTDEDGNSIGFISTLVIPANVKEIETGAFTDVCPKDVYFLSLNAPKTGEHAWSDRAYISNNSYSLSASTIGEDGESMKVDMVTGIACRDNFTSNNGDLAMLHYPSTCTKAQAARYTDLTREYKKIVYDADNTKSIGNTEYTVYEPGQETTDLKGTGNILGNAVASKWFGNMYSNGTYGGNYNGGYDDDFVGSSYQWPSLDMARRSTICAINKKLWNGVNSIGDGIRTYESDFTGDGADYIGLHEFVFAKGDVDVERINDTKDFDITNKADGEWHSICLPINITKAEMKEIFGDYKVRLCKFDKAERVAKTGDAEATKDNHLTLHFNTELYDKANDEDVVFQAHHSYMIKAEKENATKDEKIVIKNYVLVSGDPIPTNIVASNGDKKGEDENKDMEYRFIGNYLSGIMLPQYSYYYSKTYKRFRFYTGASDLVNAPTWSAYSSVLLVPNGVNDKTAYFTTGDNNANNAKFRTILDDEETDGIEGITMLDDTTNEVIYTNEKVYNLNGQVASQCGTSGLPSGIYIVNGKKVLVK